MATDARVAASSLLAVYGLLAVVVAVVVIKRLVVLLWPPLVRRLTEARSPFFARLAIRLALARDKPTGAPFEAIYGAPANFGSLQEVFERFPLDIAAARPLPETAASSPSSSSSSSSSPFVFPADGRAMVLPVDAPLLERGAKRVRLPGELALAGQKALWVYLAPRDLHWCFAPCDLTVVSVETDEHVSEHRVTQAHTLPLNRWSCLTCRREPDSPRGGRRTRSQKAGGGDEGGELLRIIMVGAFGVDDFHWKLDDAKTRTNSNNGNSSGSTRSRLAHELDGSALKPGMRVAKGAPLGHFRAGSSVLVLPWPESLEGGMATQEVVCVARTDVVAPAATGSSSGKTKSS